MTKRNPSLSADAILRDHRPDIRALAERLRAIIRDTAPDAIESANAGWHSLSYHHPQSGYFCGLFPRADDVLLVFEFGVLLPDPDDILEGDGKQVRFVTVRREKDIRVRALKKLLRAALELPASRQVKLALIRSAAKPV
jgi:hypothetical protein